MLEGLDAVPWATLTHAYGSAADVPQLIRELAAPSRDLKHEVASNEDSALDALFSNIYHQGTVYEATSYAVPFLIELVAHPSTADRSGILCLLAAIANGNSFLAVHGAALNMVMSEEELSLELSVVEKARHAVYEGFGVITDLLLTESAELRLAAAHVLAQFPERASDVAPLLRRSLQGEASSLYRAGYILLLGQVQDQSPETMAALGTAVNSGNRAECVAAAFSLANLKPTVVPPGAREAALDTVCSDYPESILEGLPWDVIHELDRTSLISALDEAGVDEAADRLLTRIESGNATHDSISTILELLFPTDMRGPAEKVCAADLSDIQRRAVKAISRTFNGGERVFVGHFPQWGLPESRREWKDLAAGRDPVPVDMTLPMLACPLNPHAEINLDELKCGARVVHRSFGAGTVSSIEKSPSGTKIIVNFEEEGAKTLLV